MSEYAWVPTPEHLERANATRLARRHGLASFAELRHRSVEDVAWFWEAVVEDLELPFERRWHTVLDTSDGVEWARWFMGGELNVTAACVSRWARAAPERTALIAEAEDGRVREVSWAALEAEVAGLAHALAEAGVRRGDTVAAFLPMIPEAVAAAYAIAALGAVYVPLFSGLGAPAVAERLRDVDARAVVAAAATTRRGRPHDMLAVLEEALESCPAVEAVIVAGDGGGRHLPWPAPRPGALDTAPTGSEDPFMVIFTSGTSGRPKGAVHVHGGFLVKVAAEAAYQADVHPGDVALWPTDMGWIMGPWLVLGCHALGATVVLAEGAPDHPDAGRLWRAVERHRVTLLGVSPSLVRGLARHGAGGEGADLSSLRTVASGGEPWDPESYEWLRRAAGPGTPIVNLSGGTEVGACFLSCHPVEPIKACSLGGPALGMDLDVLDPEGRSLRGGVGELVCRQPWPGMTRGLWRDPERYIESYWSSYPGVWRHGDWARVDEDGCWFLLGRSDEVLSLAGKRLGPAEVESVLVAHPAVAEAAAIGLPDPLKGEALWCVCVPAGELPDPGGAAEELRELVARELGGPFRPAGVLFVEALPRTRSGKVVRRLLRSLAAGGEPGDLAGLENPEALEDVRAAFRGLR